ncbi:MAG TPA: GMC family oxidoreductase N-terminal domain-containing protein, partial [Usitatibacter sp.]
PVGYLYTIGNPRTDWCFRTESEPGLNGRSLGYARGKVLGGCSSINAMVYMRGQKVDYDHWESLGNRGWSWADVLPYFKRAERHFGGANEHHGGDGELFVEEPRVKWEILDAWRDAAAECGIPKVEEFNRGDNFGNAYFHMNQRGGRRWSATNAFLRPALGRANLTLITRAHTRKVLVDTRDGVKRSTGIELVVEGRGEGVARARKAVILAAGSIGSPQILQLSGIGPSNLLQQFSIPVVHESPGVGDNLHDHLQIRMVWKVKGPTLNERSNRWLGKVAMGLEYLLFKTGPLTMPPSQLGAFAKSDPREATPDVEWHVQPLSLEKFGDPLHSFPAITPSVCNLRPTSRGAVRIRSGDPMAAPEIRLNYLSTPEDQAVAARSMRMTRRIMESAALARYSPEEWRPGAAAQSDAKLVEAAGDLGTTIFHPVGTCRMGRDERAVVDDRLRVHGIEGLRVVDASIMPRITSGNTNAPTYMIAERGAELILADSR